MLKQSFFLLPLLGSLMGVLPVSATVHITGDSLSINTNAVPLSEILQSIAQQRHFRVVDLSSNNQNDFGKRTVSEVFQNLTLEKGLDRLLKDVNFAIVKDATSGRIREVVLLSRREAESAQTNRQVSGVQGASATSPAQDPVPANTHSDPYSLGISQDAQEMMSPENPDVDVNASLEPDPNSGNAPPIPPEIQELMEKGGMSPDPSGLSPTEAQSAEVNANNPDMPSLPPEIREQMGFPPN